MPLTIAQQQAIKADIAANPDLNSQPNNADGAFEIARLYNLDASPQFVVFKRTVLTDEVGKAVNYIAVEAMTDANRNRINTFYAMNPAQFEPRSDVRTYWSNTFSGALGGQGQATRDALDALWRRNATRVEKLFATGTGTTASPASLGYEGPISPSEVFEARNLP